MTILTDEARMEPKQTWKLDRWVKAFHEIYGIVDKERPPTVLWLEAVDEASKLQEMVRRNDLSKDIVNQACKLFGWVCSFVGKYTIGANEIGDDDPIKTLLKKKRDDGFVTGEETYTKWIFNKYPGRCPQCLDTPCRCPSYRNLLERRQDPNIREQLHGIRFLTEQAKQKRRQKIRDQIGNTVDKYDKNLDTLVNMFVDIYGGTHFDLDLWKISAKVLEEVGEVGREILALDELKRIKNRLNSTLPPSEKDLKESFVKRLTGLQEEGRIESHLAKQAKDRLNKYNIQETLKWLTQPTADNLKDELADVFSWLSAFLHKVGELWRDLGYAAHYADEKGDYKIYRFLEEHYKSSKQTLGCPSCGEEKCNETCLASGAFKMVMDKKVNQFLEEAK